MCTLLFGAAYAQERRISGKVTDEKGEALPGVSVTVVGTTVGTQTDSNGTYALNVPNGATSISISYIGFITKVEEIQSRDNINVVLAENTAQLDEVVVTALGISREAKSIGYASSTIKSEELTKARESNVLNSLAGKAPGVRINSQSGTLGGSSKIVIRGINSLDASGNNVLFVIDGMTISNSTSAGGTTSNNVDYGNRLGDLSADDIESMTVLKGAAATALYGSRARDGAVIITTKRGVRGSKTSVSVNSSVRFENPLILPDFQNDYAQGTYNEDTKKYEYSLKYLNGWGPKISDVADQKFTDFTGDEVTLQAYPNNVKDFFDTGVSYFNNIAFSGGDDKSDYRLGLSAVNEKGIIPESNLKKYNFTVNAGRNFSDKLSSRFSAGYTRIDAEGRPAQSSNNTNIITSAVYGLPRVLDINKVKNNFEDPETGSQIFIGTDKTANNPYWILNYNKNNNVVDRFIGSYNLTYKPLEWLTIADNLGGDIYTDKRTSFTRKGTAGVTNGRFTNTNLWSREINNDFMVTIDQDHLVEDFKFKLILGHNINDRQTSSDNVDAADLTIDQLYNYTNAASKTPTLGFSKRRLVGVYGDLGMSYKEILFLNVTGRNDWFSTLPKASNSYFYPSVSGSFIFSELLKDNGFDWLSYGKVRASWASVGSDLTAYNLDYQYSPVSTVFLQYVSSSANIFPIGNITTAFTGPRILPNDQLKPQRQFSHEFGADLKFLDNRIGLDFTYYNTITKDNLIPIDVAISTGYFSKYVNAGSIRNTGFEVALNLVPVRTTDFSWSITGNFSRNKQRVVELIEGVNLYSVASGWSGLQIQAEVGESLGLYGTAFLRDEATGQYLIDGESGLKIAGDVKRFGSIYPDWMLGINNEFRYKGFTLSGLIDIRHGGVFYSGTVSDLRASGMAFETGGDRTPIVDKGLVEQGDGSLVENTTPVKSMQDYWGNQAKSDNTEGNVFDASYVKLREVMLSYSLPAKLFKRNIIKGAQIGLEARNVWLIKSHVPHVDPELNFFGAGSVGEGVEFNSMPSTRSIGFNVRLSF
ncbi:SusC/RagA family TonB-linked outer membrane protein [Olivibacter ginsenosidimutans]|uniref:SusC/RagA family TonB-linked outer membrane protein n=2 Tax=Olivibacter ginsenosidimutans TaxID=1176537 RepID=A0ABP9C721_9SPHI